MQTGHVRPRLAVAAAVVALGLSLALGGCGRHGGANDGTNAGNAPGTTTTSTTGSTNSGTTAGGTSLTDLQNLSQSVGADVGSLGNDEAAANDDQSNQDIEVQP